MDDRKPVPGLLNDFFGSVYGDKGYLSNLLVSQLLVDHGIRFITRLKSNIKNRIMLHLDRIMLRRRDIIEITIDQLKNISQIKRSRHRSMNNFIVNVLCEVLVYCFRPIKPSLGIERLMVFTA
ncbi:MAG: transposase [Anaerolineae bacterium]|nr:transposase [Anaerolineae bacterium]